MPPVECQKLNVVWPTAKLDFVDPIKIEVQKK